jgi:hypothetical protein
MNASLIEWIDVGEMKRECMSTAGEKASSRNRKIAPVTLSLLQQQKDRAWLYHDLDPKP